MTLGLLIKEIVEQSPKVAGEARYRSLFRQLQQAILQGRIAVGSQLPATRELAEVLGIARNTVKSSYEMLVDEGYIESRTGAGSFVAELPKSWIDLPKTKFQKERVEPLALSAYAEQILKLTPLNPDVKRSLQPAIPALDEFPLGHWKRCLGHAASEKALLSSPPEGEWRLREQVADFLLKHRGIEAGPDQIIITSGSQQAVFMVAHLLTNPGDNVLVETPGFQGTAGAFTTAGCQVTPVPLDQLSGKIIDPDAALISVTPSRNFPLGHTLPLETRLNIIQWAEHNARWVLEDDYDSEFALGRSVSAMYSLSAKQRVIYTGTFSRSMFPALRLGYLVLPESLVDVFARTRRYMDGGLSQVSQIAMSEFMSQGFFARHLRRMKQLYAQKGAYFLQQVKNHPLLAKLPVLDAEGGMHMVLGVPDEVDDQHLVALLNAQGLGVRALSGYCHGRDLVRGLVIGFCFEPQIEIDHGIDLIADSYKRCLLS